MTDKKETINKSSEENIKRQRTGLEEPKEKSIKEELEDQKKNIEIKILLTDSGYSIETSVSLPQEYVMSTLDSINRDLFVQHIYNRKDTPWMRKIATKKN